MGCRTRLLLAALFMAVCMGAQQLFLSLFGVVPFEMQTSSKPLYVILYAFQVITGFAIAIVGFLYSPQIIGWLFAGGKVMPKIAQYSIFERFRMGRAVTRHLSDPVNYTAEEFIKVAERAMKERPNEWILFYITADYYAQVGRYADALKVLHHCIELRPREIRSAYALGTAYNMLTRAEWADSSEAESILKMIGKLTGEKFSTKDAKRELDRANLAVETAAVQAMRWFEKALTLNPDSASREVIQQDLQALYQRFPSLKH